MIRSNFSTICQPQNQESSYENGQVALLESAIPKLVPHTVQMRYFNELEKRERQLIESVGNLFHIVRQGAWVQIGKKSEVVGREMEAFLRFCKGVYPIAAGNPDALELFHYGYNEKGVAHRIKLLLCAMEKFNRMMLGSSTLPKKLQEPINAGNQRISLWKKEIKQLRQEWETAHSQLDEFYQSIGAPSQAILDQQKELIKLYDEVSEDLEVLLDAAQFSIYWTSIHQRLETLERGVSAFMETLTVAVTSPQARPHFVEYFEKEGAVAELQKALKEAAEKLFSLAKQANKQEPELERALRRLSKLYESLNEPLGVD